MFKQKQQDVDDFCVVSSLLQLFLIVGALANRFSQVNTQLTMTRLCFLTGSDGSNVSTLDATSKSEIYQFLVSFDYMDCLTMFTQLNPFKRRLAR